MVILKFCECGCGEEVKFGNRFINHHNRIGSHMSKEAIEKIKIFTKIFLK